MPEQQPVTIQQQDGTQAQILMKLGSMEVKLATIETKLDVLTANTSDHESRLRILETAKAKLYGAAVASGVLSGSVATLIYWALQTHHH